MFRILKKIIKALLPVSYIRGNFIQQIGGKRNSTIFSYKNNFYESPEYEITKLDKSKSLYADRVAEIKSFYGLPLVKNWVHFIRNGTPNTDYYKYRLQNIFNKQGTDQNALKQSYDSATLMYTNRLMLRYHNYDKGFNIIEIIQSIFKKKPVKKMRVLDYGCGVADPSIILALYGASVTIVDLDDQKFEFAKNRFESRDLLNVTSMGACQTEKPVVVNGKFDVIIMAEFLEHVRSPKLFLEFAIEHLDENGILFDSLGPVYKHKIGGDHLKEAKEELDNNDYFQFFNKWLKPVNKMLNTDRYEHFYIKKSQLKDEN